jgi:hypothetical protein
MTDTDKFETCAEAAHEINRVWCLHHGGALLLGVLS